MNNPEKFLPKKYPDLPGSKPVERAVAKKLREGEKGSQTKEGRVETYLDRVEKIIARGNRVSNERGWELLKNKITKEFAIDADDPDTLAKIAHGLYESEKKMALEQGRGADIERLERELEHEGGIIGRYGGLVKEKHDIQEHILSSWLDYLKQNDAQYPMWFRYFVVRSLQKMGTMDKERGEYTKRTPYTVAPFPELNSEALGFVYRMLTEGIGEKEFAGEEDKEERQKLEILIARKDFVKLYIFAQIETAGRLNRETIEGRWVKYDQESDHHTLENTLRGKGTGWCTAEGSAYAHLQGGDFYVYYTKGPDGAFTEPRIAIRTEGGQVAEVRGVNHRQELEPSLIDIATEQYHSLPGGEKFDKKSRDMKEMTRLAKKHEKGESFTKDDIAFLYEINAPIEGFGYEEDPRIQELRNRRNPEEDMVIMFECVKEQIAHNPSEIGENTKAYVGELKPGIFNLIQKYNIEHVYTFLGGKNLRKDLEIGGKTDRDLERELRDKGIKISDFAHDILRSKDFTALKSPEEIQLIQLKMRDLGIDRKATLDEICRRAEELGLDICPAEVGPHLRLKYTDQSLNEWFLIAMKQISNRDGDPGVFFLAIDAGGLYLHGGRPVPGGEYEEWHPDDRFVFCLHKLES